MIVKRKSTWIFCSVLTALICVITVSFMINSENAAAAEGDNEFEYSLKVSGTEGVAEKPASELNVYPNDLLLERTITVTDKDGVSRDFKYTLLDYYDKDWKRMCDYGYNIYENGIWDQDIQDEDKILGKVVSFHFMIYKCNEKGKPLDKEGNEVNGVENAYFMGVTEPVKVKVLKYNPTVTKKGINYTAFLYENDGAVAYIDDEITKKSSIKGKVRIPEKIRIEEKTYPVRTISVPGFSGCSKMTEIVLPDTLKSLEAGALADTGLKNVTIPDSVEEMAPSSVGVKKDKVVPGFVIYAKNNPVAEDYAYRLGITYIDKKAAEATRIKMRAKAVKGHKVQVKWDKNKNVSGYQISMKSKKKGKYKKAAVIKNPQVSKWISKKMKSGRKMYLKMRVLTKISDKTFYGKWSRVKTITIK